MFSTVPIFQVRLRRELGAHFDIGLSEWMPLGEKVAAAEIPPAAKRINELADLIARGNWMWAVARGVENDKPFKICGYGTFSKGKWLLDAHVGEDRHEPCFGREVPHLFIPMWRTFSEVYVDCKKLLGITERTATGV